MPVEVHPYSIDLLRRVMAEKAKADFAVIEQKAHLDYFESYFAHLNAQTLVVEGDYIDRDFLEDFAAYYVRCFHDYERKCTRLHFFANAFEADELIELLGNRGSSLTAEILNETYLGFVVLKPLPQTVVGRTCLRTYEADTGREYPIKRKYLVNLYGLQLCIDTLAFQEQDSVVAACATSALWSAFQGTGVLFQHAIPSPVEITKAAAANYSSRTRDLPNAGLSPEQIAHAIRSIGLEPYTVAVRDEYVLKTTVYAYLMAGVPVIMGVRLFDASSTTIKPTFIGRHAVAVTGFRIPPCPPSSSILALRSRAWGIDRLYAHDDGVGPFARMLFDGTTITEESNGKTVARTSLSTSWKVGGHMGGIRAVPELVIVPLYHKIRIPFSCVQALVIHFDQLINGLRKANVLPLPESLEWNIRLTTVNAYKSDLLASRDLQLAERTKVLTKGLPRFLWRATACFSGRSAIDLLFDATDIEQGDFFIDAIRYEPVLATVLESLANAPQFRGAVSTECWSILRRFRSVSA